MSTSVNFSRRSFLTLAGTALGATALGLVGCGGSGSGVSSSGSGSSSDLIEVKFGSGLWPSVMFYYLAAEKGIDKENGIKLNISSFNASTETNNALVGGQIDFANYASPETIAPFTQGAPLKVVLLDDKSNGCEGIVAKPEIKTVQDLKGKTICTQLYSADHMLLLTLLQDNGMSEDDVSIVDMSIQESSNAFIAGKCDAASVWDPYFTEAKNAGGNVLYSTADNPDIITDALVTRSDVVEKNPKAVQGIVDTYFATIDWWNENKEEGSAFMGEKLGTDAAGFDEQMAGLTLPTRETAVDAFTPTDDYAYWGYTQNVIRDFMYDLKQIDSKPDCAEMVDDTFVKAALKKA